MNSFSFLALMGTALLLSEQGRATVAPQPLNDDRLVLAAVIDHTIMPVHRRTSSEPLQVISETSPLCMEPAAGASRCRIPESWRQFLEPDALRKWPGLVPDERIRRELVASLEARNAESHALPISTLPDVALIDLRKDPPQDPLDRHYRRKLGSASMSLPGYASDGHALVYGSYSCGSLCGYGWLFVLAKVEGQWRVKLATVTVIS